VIPHLPQTQSHSTLRTIGNTFYKKLMRHTHPQATLMIFFFFLFDKKYGWQSYLLVLFVLCGWPLRSKFVRFLHALNTSGCFLNFTSSRLCLHYYCNKIKKSRCIKNTGNLEVSIFLTL
jgi:hypothetical protein